MFREDIERKDFVITCEISPPRGCDTKDFEEKIRSVRGKVSAVNITDNPMLSIRMSSSHASYIAKCEGVEPIMQITCRDRNSLALTSDLLGAYRLGIRNVLVLHGDQPKEEKGVFEVDVLGLMKIINLLNEGKDIRGKELNSRCDFFVGAALNPYGEEGKIIENIELKKEGGAKFFQSQPVFSGFERIAKIIEKTKIKALLGVIIITSEKMLQNILNFSRGMEIPKEIFEKISKYEDKVMAGLEISAEIITKIKEFKIIKGVHIYSPSNEKLIPKLISMI